MHWKSQIPKRYKRTAINGYLHPSWKVILNFYHEKNEIGSKSSTPGYPIRFVDSVMNDFESKEYDPLILSYLFNDVELKPTVLIEVPFCNENEKVTKQLLKKLNAFNKEKHDFRNVWKVKEVRQFFSLKEKNPYPSCKIYERVCSCKENYTGQTKQNAIDGMSMKIQTKIQDQPNISFNTLIMFFNGKY